MDKRGIYLWKQFASIYRAGQHKEYIYTADTDN